MILNKEGSGKAKDVPTKPVKIVPIEAAMIVDVRNEDDILTEVEGFRKTRKEWRHYQI